MNKKEIIFDELVLLETVLNQKQTKERLMIYVNHLEKFELLDIIKTIRNFHLKSKYFPHVSELIEDIYGLSGNTEEIATSIASEIIELISRFGPYRENEVKKELGVKFGIVQRFGGWQSLCRIELSEVPNTRAQLRELSKVFINKSKREIIENGALEFNLNTEPLKIVNKLRKIDFQNLIE